MRESDPLRDQDRYVRIAVDLVNTRDDGPDSLDCSAAVREFLLAHDEPEPVEVTTEEWLDVAELRNKLREVFTSDTEAAAAGRLNELLAASAVAPYLTGHDGTPWHLHVSEPDASWGTWLTALTATGLALLIAHGGFDRMRVCAADDCGQVLVDHSRNHGQRFCSSTCATRTRVAAHRARHAPEQELLPSDWLPGD